MTISTTQNQVSFTGDGVSTVFPYGFPFITTADIKVFVNGVQQFSGFTTSGTSSSGGSGTFNSGTVTFSVAPAALATILLYCDPDLLQSTALPPNDPFPSKTVEKMVDKVTLLVQRLKTAFGNAITFPAGESGASGVLPDVATRASKLLTFDSLGNVQLVAPSAQDATSVALQLQAYKDQLASTASASLGDALIGQLDTSVAGAVATTPHVYLNLNVKGLKKTFGAVGDGGSDAASIAADTAAIQNALASGKIIEAEEGTFIWTTARTYSTSGFGRGLQLYGWGIEKTKFDNRVASNPMLSLDGGGTPSQYAYAMNLEGFQIFTTTNPAASIGLKLRSQWGGSVKQVKINGLTSHGIQIRNDDGDPDASAFLTLDQVFLMSNGGWGLHCVDPVTLACATGDVKVMQSYITGNSLGGARAVGIQWLFEHTTFAQNLGGGGLVVPFIAAPSTTMAHLNVFGCDFDDNTGYHIDAQACKQAEVAQSKFIYRANGTGMRIGDGGAGIVTNFEARGNTHQRQAGTVTAHLIGSNASYTRVLGSYYPTLTGVTAVSDAGTGTEVEQDGMWVKSAVKTATTTTATSYTPDVASGTYHRVVINAAGAFTVNAPVGASDGRELELNLFNASGGAVAVTFNAAISQAGFTNPANGKQKTARFRYHTAAGAWVLVGSWSPDI